MINTCGHVNWLQEGSKLLSHLVNDSGETRFVDWKITKQSSKSD